VLTAYAINCNVWCRAALKICVPLQLQSNRAAHLGSTLLLLLLATVCSMLLPFLNALVGLVGVSCGMATTYFFPCLFALKLLDLSKAESRIIWTVFLLASAVSCFGVTASIADIVLQAKAAAAATANVTAI
jgi:hypothetical protein